MNVLRHMRAARELGAYLDGELPPHRRTAITAHLRECWRCSGDARILRMIKHSFGRSAQGGSSSLASARLHRYALRLAGLPSHAADPLQRRVPPGPGG